MIDGTAQIIGPVNDDPALADLFHQKAGWDPLHNGDNLIFVLVRPSRMQAWREVDEAANRTIMADGAGKTAT